MNGLAVSRWRSREQRRVDSPAATADATVRPPSSTSRRRARRLEHGASSGFIARLLLSRASRLSTVWRSARISSVLMVSMSLGRVDRAVDVDDIRVVEAAHHLAIASASRMWARNLLPSPSPLATRP